MLNRVFLWERLGDGREATIWGQHRAGSTWTKKTGSQFLLLEDGHRYEGQAGLASYRVVKFDRLSQRLETQASGSNRVGISGVLTAELADDAEGRAEWHWRVAAPLFAFISALLAIGIARVRPRAGRFAKVVPGLGLLLAYYVGMLSNQYALGQSWLPSAVGMWPVHVVFALLAFFLLRRVAKPIS